MKVYLEERTSANQKKYTVLVIEFPSINYKFETFVNNEQKVLLNMGLSKVREG